MPRINLSYWEMKEKLVSNFSLVPWVLFSNLQCGRIMLANWGNNEINSIQQIFISC